MKKNITYISLFCFFFINIALSQNAMFVSLSPTVNSGNIKGMNNFFESYNTFFQNDLNSGFTNNLTIMPGYTIMFGGSINGVFEPGVGFGRTYGRNTATYKNGDKQIFNISQSDYMVDVMLGSSFESSTKISFNCGMVFRDANVRLFYKNNNGLKDYHIQYYQSMENRLNGFYHSWSSSFYAGISIGSNIDDGVARVFFRADYVFAPIAASDFTDNEPTKQPSLTVGQSDRIYLPEDVSFYFSGSNAGNVFNSVKNKNSGIRLMLTFQYNIGDL